MGNTLPKDDNNEVIAYCYKSLTANRKVVTTAGSAVQLSATSVSIKRIDIMAETGNTGLIAVGNSAVVAAQGSQKGIILTAGQAFTFYVTDLNLVYIDATVSGEGITYIYFD